MLSKCGCNNISYEPIEFEIKEIPILLSTDVELPKGYDFTDCLKLKAVEDYLQIISKLECGTLPDLEFLLLELSILDINFYEAPNILKQV